MFFVVGLGFRCCVEVDVAFLGGGEGRKRRGIIPCERSVIRIASILRGWDVRTGR